MKTKIAILALFPAALLTLNSCSGIPGTERTVAVQTKDGAAIVETFESSATVTSVNSGTRKLTLKFSNGQTKTVKAGPDVANFSQIRSGDHVNLTMTEEFAVFLGAGNPSGAVALAGVKLAPLGAKPGGYVADSITATAKITSVNRSNRKVGVTLPDGSTTTTVKAGNDVDLKRLKPGDTVNMVYAESMAISVTKG